MLVAKKSPRKAQKTQKVFGNSSFCYKIPTLFRVFCAFRGQIKAFFFIFWTAE
jgi:hypothetical protein